MGFRLNPKWGGALSVQSPFSASSSSWPSSYSCRGWDSFCFSARSSIVASFIYGETETLADTSKPHTFSSSPQNLENYYLAAGDIKMALGKGSGDGLYSLLDNILMSNKEDKLGYLTSLKASQASQLRLLMKNLDLLEGMFVDTDVVRLESDILKQLERLGALSLFDSCLSRIESSNLSDISNAITTISEEPKVNDSVDKVFIQSGKKEIRKMKRRKLLEKEKTNSRSELLPLESISRYPQSGRKPSRSRNKRQKIARNEAEMSGGVKTWKRSR